MLLHLLRHAHALAEEEDPVRPLSPRGRGEVARLARFLGAGDVFRPEQIWHSPLARSRQTADDLAARLLLIDALRVEIPGLLPEDDPQELAERLHLHPKDRGDIAIVGHEPHLSVLASLLVRGKARPDLFTLKKCALITLELTDATHKKTGHARWRVRWHISPELLPAHPATSSASATASPEPIVNQ